MTKKLIETENQAFLSLNKFLYKYYTLDSAMMIDKAYESGKWYFEDKAAFLYDCFRILVDINPDNHKRILKFLSDEMLQSNVIVQNENKNQSESK